MATSQFKELRHAYGFDEVAIVPGDMTVNPDQTNIDFKVDNLTFSIPIIAAAMDGVTDINFAILMSKLGGLAVLNLEGIQTRYENPREILAEIAQAPDTEVTPYCKRSIPNRLKRTLSVNEFKPLSGEGQYVLFRWHRLIPNGLLR